MNKKQNSRSMKKTASLFIILAIMLLILSPTSVLASESSPIINTNITVQPIEETEFTKETAIKSLNLTPEEAAKSDIYVVTIPLDADSTMGTLQYTIPANVTFNWTPFTFYQYNGGSYWTVNANYIKWGIASFTTPDDPNNYDLRLGVYLKSYGQEAPVDQVWIHSGETYFSPSWIPVTWGHDYRFLYYCSYLTDPRIYGTATVQMYVATSS